MYTLCLQHRSADASNHLKIYSYLEADRNAKGLVETVTLKRF